LQEPKPTWSSFSSDLPPPHPVSVSIEIVAIASSPRACLERIVMVASERCREAAEGTAAGSSKRGEHIRLRKTPVRLDCSIGL
jgi:hypothetical protein